MGAVSMARRLADAADDADADAFAEMLYRAREMEGNRVVVMYNATWRHCDTAIVSNLIV